MTLSKEVADKLREWLDNQEYNIADDVEDYGELKMVFKEVMGREPSIYSP